MLSADSMRSDIVTEKAINYIKGIAAQPADEAPAAETGDAE